VTPYLVWLCQASVRNGNGAALHERPVAVRQEGGTFSVVEPGVILDLAPVEVAPPLPASLASMAGPGQAVRVAAAELQAGYLPGVQAEQQREVSIIREAVERSLSDVTARLQEDLDRQYDQEAAGRDMRIAIQTTSRRIDDATQELRTRREELRRRAMVTPTRRRSSVLQPWCPIRGRGRSSRRECTAVDRRAIELAAMRYAEAFERRPRPRAGRRLGAGCGTVVGLAALVWATS
jgi:hypothetical protein